MNRVALVLVALSLVTGCGKIREKLAQKAAEKAVETSTGGDVKISSGGVTVKDAKGGGAATFGDSAKLPDGWPSDVPAYPDAKIVASMATPQGKTTVMETKDAPAKVADFYKSKLSSFARQSDVDAAGVRQLVYKSGSRTIQVVASPSGDKTNISISVAGG